MDSESGHIQEDEATPGEGVIAIPWQHLSEDALVAIMDDFITREGTDYGDYADTLEAKRGQVLGQIQTGKVVILFDPVESSCHLVLKENLPSDL
ncbi:MAG: YheU family protein [Oleibacter sp.]|nr:YheU family protein [Thalassolituus sp.]